MRKALIAAFLLGAALLPQAQAQIQDAPSVEWCPGQCR